MKKKYFAGAAVAAMILTWITSRLLFRGRDFFYL